METLGSEGLGGGAVVSLGAGSRPRQGWAAGTQGVCVSKW